MRVEALFNKGEIPTIEEYLKRCGVNSPKLYIKPDSTANESYENYTNIWDAMQLLEKARKGATYHDKHIAIVCDSDCDGYCSSAMAKRFLIHFGVPKERISVLFHSGKQHGLSKDILTQLNKGVGNTPIALIWLPDAGTNDVEACGYYTDCFNIPVLITDHHIADRQNGYGLIVNNQTSENVTNKDLCGTGVTYKVISAYCNMAGDNFHQSIVDLVALATISDVMDMRSVENRLFVKWGLSHINNTFLIGLCEAFIANGNINPTSIAWDIVPKINAVCRSDDAELKQELFNALCDDVWDEGLIDRLRACHQKQRNEVDKLYQETLAMHPMGDKVKIFVVENTPYSGLVANKLSDYYSCPVMVVHESYNKYIGSLRSPCPMKTQLNDTNLMTLCMGHECACGVGWYKNTTDELIAKCKQLDFTPAVKEVTYSTDNVLMGRELFDMHDEYMDVWGQGIPEPTVHFSNITISGQDIKELGTNKTTIKFLYGDIEFIQFFVSKEKKELTKVGRNVIMNMEIIGTPSINRFRDKETKQIVIKEMEIK